MSQAWIRPRALLITALVAVVSTATAAPARLSAPQVLERVRSAVGFTRLRAMKQGVQLEGTANSAGLEAPFTLTMGPGGEFAQTSGGRLPAQSGFDGKTAWAVDWNGILRRLDLRELESEQATNWLMGYRWLAPNGPFTIEVEEAQPDDAQLVLLLSLKGGLLRQRLSIDRASWLPRVATDITAAEPETITFRDYRLAEGVRYPHVIEMAGQGEQQVMQITRVRPAPTFIRSPYAMPVGSTGDFRFAEDVPPLVEARRARTGHILVHPRVDGEDVGWFILDSGAGSMVITPDVSRKLQMEGFGRIAAVGVGGTIKSRFCQAKRFDLGPLTLGKPTFIEIDLGQIAQVFGVPIAGICGYEVFGRAIVSMDVTRPVVEIHDPRRYRIPGGGDWSELLLNRKIPVVRAGFEGNREALFTLDTGANNTLVFHAPTVQRLRLLEGRETRSAQSGGVGGLTQLKAGRIEYFTLGGRRFENPLVQFSEAQKGAFTEAYTAGNVGTGFLGQFRLVLNYPERKIAFLPKE